MSEPRESVTTHTNIYLAAALTVNVPTSAKYVMATTGWSHAGHHMINICNKINISLFTFKYWCLKLYLHGSWLLSLRLLTSPQLIYITLLSQLSHFPPTYSTFYLVSACLWLIYIILVWFHRKLKWKWWNLSIYLQWIVLQEAVLNLLLWSQHHQYLAIKKALSLQWLGSSLSPNGQMLILAKTSMSYTSNTIFFIS